MRVPARGARAHEFLARCCGCPAAPCILQAAEGFVSFVNDAVSPYHAVAASVERLEAAGFKQLTEREEWHVEPNGRYYVVRNQSAVIAFAVGGAYVPGNGFTVAAAHTDSPCLRVKPVSSLTKSGYLSVGVETYGGGLWYTWLDRDLSVAGRVVVAKPDGTFDSQLVRIRRPILRIPSLAIHLNREVNSDGLKLNAETHLAPVMATVVKSQLEGFAPTSAASAAAAAAPAGTGGAETRHHAALVSLLATELGVEPESVKDFDLCLYDTQPSAIGGIHNEFIFSRTCTGARVYWCACATTRSCMVLNTARIAPCAAFLHLRMQRAWIT
ncbi:hypothetical protein EON67_03180 [archaeon]|nr:MAG: hypothetical protein EON67_03180 [archaeon]